MRPLFYLRRLKEDVASWVEKGIISPGQGEAILDDIGAPKGANLSQLLVVLGALLAGAAAISFIAANWDGTPKTLRLSLMLALLIAAAGVAAMFFRRERDAAAQAFVLLTVALFGANINLVGQTYHVNADYPDGLMIWALGALAAAVVVPSRTALGAALVLGAIWTSTETWQHTPGLHLPYAVFWGAAAALAIILKWRGGAHLVALSALFWLLISFEPLATALGLEELEIFSWYGAVALALFSLTVGGEDRPMRIAAFYGALVFLAISFFWHAAALGALDQGGWREAMRLDEGRGLAVFLRAHLITGIAGLGFLIAAALRRLPPVAALAGLAIVTWEFLGYFLAPAIGPLVSVVAFWIAVVAVIAIGAVLGRRGIINLGLVAFGAGVLDLYFETFKGLLGTSLVFLSGALLFFALAFVIRFAGKRLARGEAAP